MFSSLQQTHKKADKYATRAGLALTPYSVALVQRRADPTQAPSITGFSYQQTDTPYSDQALSDCIASAWKQLDTPGNSVALALPQHLVRYGLFSLAPMPRHQMLQTLTHHASELVGREPRALVIDFQQLLAQEDAASNAKRSFLLCAATIEHIEPWLAPILRAGLKVHSLQPDLFALLKAFSHARGWTERRFACRGTLMVQPDKLALLSFPPGAWLPDDTTERVFSPIHPDNHPDDASALTAELGQTQCDSLLISGVPDQVAQVSAILASKLPKLHLLLDPFPAANTETQASESRLAAQAAGLSIAFGLALGAAV